MERLLHRIAETDKLRLTLYVVEILACLLAAIAIVSNLETTFNILTKANRSARNGDYDNAVFLYERVLERDAANTDAYTGLAELYISSGELNLAEEIVEEASAKGLDGNAYIRSMKQKVESMTASGLANYDYSFLPDNYIIITRYKGYEAEITIPKEWQIDNNSYQTKIRSSYLDGEAYAFLSPGVKKLSFEDGVIMESGYYLLKGCVSLEQIDLSGLQTDEAEDLTGMFFGCSALEAVDISMLQTSKVKTMRSMFGECRNLREVNFGNINTDSLEDLCNVFYGCSSLEKIDLRGLNTENVFNMSSMFRDCRSLTDVLSDGIQTENVSKMDYMFSGCSALTSLDVSSFSTDQVTNMRYMFQGCTSLRSLDLTGFITDNVTDMGMMFSGCEALSKLRVDEFHTQRTSNMEFMFHQCSALKELDLSSFDMTNTTDFCSMFDGCSSLISLNTPVMARLLTSLPGSFHDPDGKIYTELPLYMDESVLLVR